MADKTKKRYPYRDFRAGSHWKEFRIIRSVDGFVLYERLEWGLADTADHEADVDGYVLFQGRATGERIPAEIRRHVA